MKGDAESCVNARKEYRLFWELTYDGLGYLSLLRQEKESEVESEKIYGEKYIPRHKFLEPAVPSGAGSGKDTCYASKWGENKEEP